MAWALLVKRFSGYRYLQDAAPRRDQKTGHCRENVTLRLFGVGASIKLAACMRAWAPTRGHQKKKEPTPTTPPTNRASAPIYIGSGMVALNIYQLRSFEKMHRKRAPHPQKRTRSLYAEAGKSIETLMFL